VLLDEFRANITACPATGAALHVDDRIAHLTKGRGEIERLSWLFGQRRLHDEKAGSVCGQQRKSNPWSPTKIF
jgi:hypothetical protein